MGSSGTQKDFKLSLTKQSKDQKLFIRDFQEHKKHIKTLLQEQNPTRVFLYYFTTKPLIPGNVSGPLRLKKDIATIKQLTPTSDFVCGRW